MTSRTVRTPHTTSLLHAIIFTVMMILAGFATGCGDDPQPATPANDCAAGDEGCACVEDACPGGANLVCDTGRCRKTCELGAEGCACRVDGCGVTSDGESLACSGGVCVVPECLPGGAGCACADGQCGPGLECTDDICQSPDCTPGTLGCLCVGGTVCAGGATCSANSGRCEEGAGCTPGNRGCDCLAGGACVGALVCSGGVCDAAECAPGLEGCACLDGACGQTSGGQPLVCTAGVCERSACPSGRTGCACRGGSDCDDDGVSCVNGYCVPGQCIPGDLNCQCLGGGCNVGLTCQNNTVCVDNTGQEGGACRANGSCDRNTRCEQSANRCVYCDLGTIACQCRDDDTCSPGLQCLGGLCIGDEAVHNRRPPTNPTCYTPCADDLVSAEGTRVCSAEGLMEGCTAGQECVRGSCVPLGQEPAECFEDSGCPDFQHCIQGACYGECESNAECTAGMVCDRKICRLPCAFRSSTCPAGTVCEADDGENGVCVPTADTDDTVNLPTPPGPWAVSESVLEFSNVKLERFFMLENNTNDFITFTVRKLEHSVHLSNGTNERRRATADDTCTGSDCPLWWVQMGEFGAISQRTSVTVRAEPHCGDACPTVFVRLPTDGIDATRWRGALQIESNLGTDTVNLSYVQRPDGQWAGQVYYFSNFETEGINTAGQVDGWVDRADKDDVRGVRNGLIQRWGAFRNGDMTGGWNEFLAVLTATQTGQWRFPSVREDCIARNGACYLFDAGAGASPKVFVTALQDAPIPTGVTEFPMEINLYTPDPTNAPTELSGKVVSRTALHYAGDPMVDITFSANPADARNCDPDVRSNCVVFINDLQLDLAVGGRYMAAEGEGCRTNFDEHVEPWLVPGFLGDAWRDPDTGLYRKSSCVDNRLPYYGSTDTELLTENRNLADSNPIPDGAVRHRTVEILDGAMIDQSQLFVLFRERFPSFLGDGEDLEAYGYMRLYRAPAEIDVADSDGNGVPDGYQGSRPPADLVDPPSQLGVACSADLLADILGPNVALNTSNAPAVITSIIEGGLQQPADALNIANGPRVHYLCTDTGLFDGGPENTAAWGSGAVGPNDDSCAGRRNGMCEDGLSGSESSTCAAGADASDCGFRYTDVRIACPEASEVIYFVTDRSFNVAGQTCQQSGTCLDTLNGWIQSGTPSLVAVDPIWRCEDENLIFCSNNRLDLRHGKTFFLPSADAAYDVPLQAAIDDAFRYRTRFRSRSDGTLGFAPEICEPFSDTTPYCYDPFRIEDIRDRVDCLLSIYEQLYADPAATGNPGAADLYTYLEESFSFREEPSALGGLPRRLDGFERLYAELLIMQGDDAYTKAFESRFDLAGSRTAGFEGSSFEEDGIDLSGIAGYEMFRLHQAVQYYELALNRFYFMSPVIGAALMAGPPSADVNFVSAEMVTSYLDRVVRASTQKSRALAEIARRYQSFNRPDLARRVTRRAYTATYLEAIALANIIQRIYVVAGGTDRPQLLVQLEDAQLRYRMALLDLANVHQSITDDVNFFGLPPDYIPFPALDVTANQSANAFDAILVTARSKVDVARQREQNALTNARSFDTDAAQFQAELTRITRTYESQLNELCGTFEASNGQIYPTIERYANLDPGLAALGDPCGFVGNGQIHQALGRIELLRISQQRLVVQIRNVLESVQIETERVSAYCGEIFEAADYNYTIGEEHLNMALDQQRAENRIQRIQRITEAAATGIQTAVCDSTFACVASGIAVGALALAYTAQELFLVDYEQQSLMRQEERGNLELDSARWNAEQPCDIAEIDSNAQTRNLLLQLRELDINGIELEYQMKLAFSDLVRLRQQAKRVQLEQRESIQLTINVEAARNDPNVRIYRNDAVINADIAFNDALREIYRLTLVYQFYTSQSYNRLGELFLIRLVSSGDYNLENYLIELENAMTEFEEQYGNPDLRVAVVSLRDDILRIPRLDDEGRALSVDARARQMRERLRDPALLDKNGYLSIPFRTNVEDLSPLTRNHKVFYLEANVEGNDNGDFLGRVYVRQNGTGVIRALDGDTDYYRFPQRTAVINTFFNSTREFASNPEVYRNYRLRDRPMVNTGWELVINQRDEVVNQDINLGALTDIKLYVFYTDFTAF